MSVVGDALKAVKDVVLMQERLDVMRTEQKRISDDVGALSLYAQALDRRVVRIETLIEVSNRRALKPPRIEE